MYGYDLSKWRTRVLSLQYLYSSSEGISVFFTSMIAYETLGVVCDGLRTLM